MGSGDAATQLGFMQVLQDEYMMEGPLAERCGKRPGGCLRRMLWAPHVLFAGIIVLSLAIYVWPGVGWL